MERRSSGTKAARKALLAWYDTNRRDLPWRRTRDPYAIWVSEAMLQQTRVETVVPYYERFLARFPDVASLADAEVESVYELWAGLGYYSRARNLKAAAEKIRREFGGALPPDAEALRTLPGIGRYTAGAIASIAFDRPEPVVDGNVERVLARRLGIRRAIPSRDVSKRIWDEAARLAAGPRPGDLNQALMELGATVCLPRVPRCGECPWRRGCDARAAGDAESLPRKAPRARQKPIRAAAALLLRGGRALVVRRVAGSLLGGFFELPGVELERGEELLEVLPTRLRERLGVRVDGLEGAGAFTHVFTHRRLRLHLFRGCCDAGRIRLRGYDRHRWVSVSALDSLPSSTLTRRAIDALVGRAGS